MCKQNAYYTNSSTYVCNRLHKVIKLVPPLLIALTIHKHNLKTNTTTIPYYSQRICNQTSLFEFLHRIEYLCLALFQHKVLFDTYS